MLRLHGTPVELDLVLRPVARTAAFLVGVVVGAILLGFGALAWAPLPLVVALGLYQVVFWWRGDRPVRLELDEGSLRMDDPRGGHRVSVALADIHAATLLVRPSSARDRREAVLVLTDTVEVRFAARFLIGPAVALGPDDVRADAIEALLGGTGGMRGLAPAGASCRQVIDDPDGAALAFLRERLPAATWARTALRVWQGAAPALDGFGVHAGPPAGLLVLEGRRWALLGGAGARAGEILRLDSGRAERSFRRLRRLDPADVSQGGLPVEEVILPLLVLRLDEGLTVAVPAPGAGQLGAPVALDERSLHTHAPEGAALLWHLFTRWPASDWPDALREPAQEALGDLPLPGPHGAGPGGTW